MYNILYIHRDKYSALYKFSIYKITLIKNIVSTTV